MRVEDVMTRDVVTTTPDTPIRDLARVLDQRRISGLPVVADGRVVGVISEADVLAKARRADDDERGALQRLLHHGPSPAELKHEARVVADAMTAPAVTVDSFSSVATAAARMLEHDVNRLPVVVGEELVGIVSRADIVRAFARPDEQVLDEVRETVEFHQALTNDRGEIDIALTDGDAVLTGSVRRHIDAETLEHLVRQVPGVVDVRSELRWIEED